jgi:hypothetical protein
MYFFNKYPYWIYYSCCSTLDVLPLSPSHQTAHSCCSTLDVLPVSPSHQTAHSCCSTLDVLPLGPSYQTAHSCYSTLDVLPLSPSHQTAHSCCSILQTNQNARSNLGNGAELTAQAAGKNFLSSRCFINFCWLSNESFSNYVIFSWRFTLPLDTGHAPNAGGFRPNTAKPFRTALCLRYLWHFRSYLKGNTVFSVTKITSKFCLET